jgi:hypothetical protein
MASNPIDVVIPLLQRMYGLRGSLGTDITYSDAETYNILVLNTLVDAVIIRMMQKIHPTIVTDAALMAEFDAALNLSAGQTWDTVTKRIAMLGSDPATNQWLPRP